ncbi:discoidin domain-containing protein [Mucilaginibacter celer]|uniref:Beta-mannosidase n=1 Tax=Mucilaginibacter celer TaxID=2305508 RepID=A0A494VJC6_9SPHI|nr:discoidin domain-containing protein [Mucilaginibacter celer]AYL93889.1 beta-mannosidase [Mucilaginibacter celer]
MFKRFSLSRFLIVILTGVCSGVYAQSNEVSLNSSSGQQWKVKPQADVTDASQIKDAGYNTSGWVTAVVPGTTFASYVAAALEKDPNFGDNIYKVDKAKYDRSFWYRTEFGIPASYTKKTIWLNFRGVNRKADIYLNGTLLGTLDGFMQRGHFDISALASRNGKNVLTALVYIPKQPLANVGSPNYVSSAGWDWMPYVPGLNSGITDNVFLSNTGDVTIKDPWIRAELPTNARADLSVALEVKNNAASSQAAIIKGVITPGNIEFQKKVYVDANGSTDVKLTKRDFEQLMINSPKLWWPNGYGEPNLYNCKLSVSVGDEVSDVRNIKFGIKRYSYDTIGHVLHLAINGTKVFIKGGDWGMSEYLLRCRGAEYDYKVKLHKEMNFNMIRNWIGSTTDEEFYDACDKYGIMVWDDFWLNANPNLPADLTAFNANAIEKIKRFRNHPAIAVWCADNEGWPEQPLSAWLKEDLATFDGGDRWYQPNSHAENLTGSGPWDAKDPRYYFTAYPTGLGGNKGWGLRSELGTAVFVNFESFKKFMPKENWWPRNEMWDQHFFGPRAFNAGPDSYQASITNGYGEPKGIEDFCRKAQFVSLESNKAMFEGWQDAMGEDASGLMTWMSQSAYPSMVWQTYDYYYDLTGAYWGVKKACEPLHIQWNPLTNAIKVINTTRKDVDGLTASADVYNLDGTLVKQYSISKTIDAPANSSGAAFDLKFNQYKADLAKNKKVVSSSSTNGDASAVNDGNPGTRWASRYNDGEWVYIDLGKEEVVNGVGLSWEDAYAKSFKIQVSNDANHWYDVYSTTEGRQGEQKITFPEVNARYVKMQGVERATYWGYSLYNFEVYEGDVASEGLSAVHFIKLKLSDNTGKIVSDNFYWRGNKRKDYTALNNLPKVDLKVDYKTVKADGKYYITAQVTNPSSSKAVAFGVRVQAVKASTGEQILPGIMSDNYFTLLKGESKTVKIEFDEAALGKDAVKLEAEAYNNTVAGR